MERAAIHLDSPAPRPYDEGALEEEGLNGNGTLMDKAYEISRDIYAEAGVDTEQVLQALQGVSISLHCWQGDDVGGFESPSGPAAQPGGGLRVTGRYLGRPRTVDELRQDLQKAFKLIPGRHRLNLHAIYGEFGALPVDRDAIEPTHFRGWLEWARQQDLRLDFNSTCFGHPLAESGATLSHWDRPVRRFWIEHVRRCRKIAATFGRELKSASIHNLWIPDGAKEVPHDRWSPRERLKQSLDEIFETDYSLSQMKDALESKLFGIGSESYVVGSHEFYMGYAIAHHKMLCLDLGHFHPTESVADKISAVLQFSDELLLHVSRGVRWDSDHVPLLNEDVLALAREIVRGGGLGRVHIALDYFDASMNRVGALVLGARTTLQALLIALLEPRDRLGKLETAGSGLDRLALEEELKSLPFGPVWNRFCDQNGVPPGSRWLQDIEAYEKKALSKRR